MKSSLTLACALAVALPLSTPVNADPAIGAGVTYTFGSGFGAGVKLFSDDEEDSFAGSIGIDYQFNSRSIRPNLGLQYLYEDVYLGADIGAPIGQSDLDFGLNLGFVNTQP